MIGRLDEDARTVPDVDKRQGEFSVVTRKKSIPAIRYRVNRESKEEPYSQYEAQSATARGSLYTSPNRGKNPQRVKAI